MRPYDSDLRHRVLVRCKILATHTHGITKLLSVSLVRFSAFKLCIGVFLKTLVRGNQNRNLTSNDEHKTLYGCFY